MNGGFGHDVGVEPVAEIDGVDVIAEQKQISTKTLKFEANPSPF